MLVSASKDSTLKVRSPPSSVLHPPSSSSPLPLFLSSRSLTLPFAREQLWDLKTYKIRVDLPGHTDEVYCVDFVADKIASGGRDKKVKM
jgi:WD40 repeat protein